MTARTGTALLDNDDLFATRSSSILVRTSWKCGADLLEVSTEGLDATGIVSNVRIGGLSGLGVQSELNDCRGPLSVETAGAELLAGTAGLHSVAGESRSLGH